MRNNTALSIVSLLGGGIVFALRLAQNHTGFSPETGLPVPGNLPGLLLLIALAAFAAVCFILSRRLPARHPDPRPFEEVFFGSPAPLAAGIFLLALSGGLDIWAVLQGGFSIPPDAALPSVDVNFFPPASILAGGLTAFSAVCLFPAAAAISAGKRSHRRHSVAPPALLMPLAPLVVRLVLTYRLRSSSPVLAAYCLELLAISALILAFFRLAAFAYEDGSTQSFPLWSAASVIFCCATLGDGHDLSGYLFFGGCALIQLGFLLAFRPAARIRAASLRRETEELL